MKFLRKLVRTVLERVGSAAGFEVTANWRVRDKPLEETLRAMFQKLQVSTVVDIGANEGQFHDFLRDRVGFTGVIHSFEPDPSLAERLTLRASKTDPHWKIHPVALGAAPGHLQLNIMHLAEFNSFLPPSEDQPRLGDNDDLTSNVVTKKVTVEVKTLDEFAPSFGNLSRTYLKIDTQGFDLQVLAGGANTVSRVPALQTEVSCRPLYKGSPTFQESLDAFGKAGFSVVDFFLIVSDQSMAAVEFDCVMVRRTPLSGSNGSGDLSPIE